MIVILGFAGVVPRFYARVGGRDCEVVFDWDEELTLDKRVFSAFVAVSGAYKMIPSIEIREEVRRRDMRTLARLENESYEGLVRRWQEPQEPTDEHAQIRGHAQFHTLVQRLVEAQWRTLGNDSLFGECCDQVRGVLLAHQVIGRVDLMRLATQICAQLVDPIPLAHLYERLVLQGHLDGIFLR
jgi:hypothetical protein